MHLHAEKPFLNKTPIVKFLWLPGLFLNFVIYFRPSLTLTLLFTFGVYAYNINS